MTPPDTQIADAFFARLQEEIAGHRALHHPFLLRFREERLTREQLTAYAVQHYMYSRFFTRNLAALLSNVPDETARSLLIINLYEEIGEPHRLRDRVHLLLISAGLVRPEDVTAASLEVVERGQGDIVQVLIARGLVEREQVQALMHKRSQEARELTHPAIFRRFLRSLGLTPEVLERAEPTFETAALIAEYQRVCRGGHWLEGMGAMGPGTECVVPTMYTYIEEGIARSGLVLPDDYLFFTIHIHCDDGHGANIINAMRTYARSPEDQGRIATGARRVLDARAAWYDGLSRLIFGTAPLGTERPPSQPMRSRPLRISRAPRAL